MLLVQLGPLVLSDPLGCKGSLEKLVLKAAMGRQGHLALVDWTGWMEGRAPGARLALVEQTAPQGSRDLLVLLEMMEQRAILVLLAPKASQGN